jgi:hypothetical protein
MMAAKPILQATDLLHRVEELAAEGHGKGEIAKLLGLKSTMTLNSRLVKASQQSGRPIPLFRVGTRKPKAKPPVQTVQIKRRGKGGAFGVNIPQEPLERLGVAAGDHLTVSVGHRRILLTPAQVQSQEQPGPKLPRLIRKGRDLESRREDT